eukprot:gene16645-25533_t
MGVEEQGAGTRPTSSRWHTALQVAVVAYAAYVWFSDCFLDAWKSVAAQRVMLIGDYMEEHAIFPNETTLPDSQRVPATAAVAGLHTVLVLSGMAAGNSLKAMRPAAAAAAAGVSLPLAVGAGLFHALRYAYGHEGLGVAFLAKTHHWPADVAGAPLHFAALCSAAMTAWFSAAAAFAFALPAPRYLPNVVGVHLLTAAAFRCVCALGEAPAGLPGALAATHTVVFAAGSALCGAASRVADAVPAPAAARRMETRNLAVLAVLVVAFSSAFSQWVAYALEERVCHVTGLVDMAFGPGAAAAAPAGQHTLVLTSYTLWFGLGVLFEQSWAESSTNAALSAGKPPSANVATSGFIAGLVAIVFPFVASARLLSGVAVVVLLWPSADLAEKDKRAWGSVAPGSYCPEAARKKWERASADCPRTGARYLVVGVGFLGTRLVRKLLARGEARVRCFDCAAVNPFEGDPRVEYIQGDVTDYGPLEEACAGVHTVYSTFAIIRYWERLEFQRPLNFNVNVGGTRNVIRACRACHVTNLIQTSTSHVVASTDVATSAGLHMTVLDEDAPLVNAGNAITHYGWSKAIAEREVRAADGVGGLRTVSVRPCSGVIGYGDKQVVERIYSSRVLALQYPK